MPLLGSVNAGIYRNQEVIPWPGQQAAAQSRTGQPPRADTPLLKLELDQQKEQAINAIFQKHGTDYDGAVEEVMGLDPEKGQQLAGLLADGRKKAAQQHVAETDSSLKDLEMVQRGVQVAIKDPSKYPMLLQELAKKPGWSRYAQMAPDPNDPDLVPKLEAILPALGDTTEFLKVNRQSALDYINGDVQLGAARSLAEATTPEKRQIVVAQLQGGGVGALADTWKTPEEAAAARDAMLEQKAKPEKSATVGSFEDYMTSDPAHRAQILTDRKAYNQADDKTPVAGGGGEKKRGVTAGDTNKIAEYNSSLADLDILEKTIGPGATGIAASAGAALPNWATNLTGWGEGAKSRQATIDLVKQVIGKALEGGVLRKEDEVKYAKILPTISDPEGVVRTKIKGLREAIQKKREEHFSALEDAGYDVSKFRARQEGVKPKTGPGPKADPLGIR